MRKVCVDTSEAGAHKLFEYTGVVTYGASTRVAELAPVVLSDSRESADFLPELGCYAIPPSISKISAF